MASQLRAVPRGSAVELGFRGSQTRTRERPGGDDLDGNFSSLCFIPRRFPDSPGSPVLGKRVTPKAWRPGAQGCVRSGATCAVKYPPQEWTPENLRTVLRSFCRTRRVRVSKISLYPSHPDSRQLESTLGKSCLTLGAPRWGVGRPEFQPSLMWC